MRLLALVFSCSLFPRLCEVDLCPLSGLEGQAVSQIAPSTAKSFILTRQQIKNYPTFGGSKMN